MIHLGKLEFGMLFCGFTGTEWGNVHFLRLLPHLLLVVKDSLDNKKVAVNDEEKWNKVHKEAVYKNVRFGKPLLV